MYELLIQKFHVLVSGKGADLQNVENMIDLENLLFVMSFSIQLIDSHEEIKNFSTLLNVMLKMPGDKFTALRRTVIDIIYIISSFLKDLEDDTINSFLEYVVDGFKSRSTFDVSSQCFERMIVLNLNRFSTYLGKFIQHLDTLSKYTTSYNSVWSKSYTAVVVLAINVLGNSPEEFKEAFQMCLTPFVDILQLENRSPSEVTF